MKSVARPDRRTAGRTWALETPLALRTSGVSVDPDFRDRILRRLGWRLGKFALHVERLTIRFEDVNGPRGGRDIECTIKVVLSGLPSVVVRELARSAPEAFARADGRIERVVKDAIGRARELGGLSTPRPRRAPARGARSAGAKGARAATPRNFNRRARKATVALETSALPRPSRKSTRGSANRAKHANKLARREQRRVSSPKGKRARASHRV